MRALLLAPMRCRTGRHRFWVFALRAEAKSRGSKQGLARYLGLAGKEQKIRDQTLTILVTVAVFALTMGLLFFLVSE